MHAWNHLRPRRIAAAFTALGLSAAGIIGFAGVASAHGNTLAGVAACQSDGTYTITWTASNDWNLSEAATVTASTGGGTLNHSSIGIAASGNGKGGPGKHPYATGTIIQSGVAGGTSSASLTISAVWSDGATQKGVVADASGLTGCGAPPSSPPATVTPAAPSLMQAACNGVTPEAGSITINATTGVVYQIGGNPVTGTITGPGTYTITAVPADSTYTLTGTTSWTLTIDATPTCTKATPTVSATGTCNAVTYTLTNPTAVAVTFVIDKSTDGGTTYTTVDSVTVSAGATTTKTESGAGRYEVLIGASVQAGSQHTVSGACSNPNPPAAPVLSVSATIASSCPTVAGKTGSYLLTATNSSTSTESVEFRAIENGTVVATSAAVAPGAAFTHAGTLTAGEAVTITSTDSVNGGVTWVPVVITNPAAVVCPKVLGVSFGNPPPSTPTTPTTPKTPSGTLPFTGIPVLSTLLVGLGLVCAGGLLIFAGRRRASRTFGI
jgi:hypothetical protein